MVDVVIIGAGLTGLSAAYHLEKNGFYSFAILEKEASIGGLCRSVQQDGFTFDYTGHLLHSSDPYFTSLLETTVGLETFNTITRRSYVYSHQTHTHYPFQMHLHGLPEEVIIDCIIGFVQRKQTKKSCPMFPDWVKQQFGTGFARHFFLPYQTKIFAYNIDKITATWTGRFVPSTSLEQIIRGALRDTFDPTIGYNAHFFYPKKGGIFSWIDQFARAIKTPIALKRHIARINTTTNTVVCADGSAMRYRTLINTMPLDTLLKLLTTDGSLHLQSATRYLRCNSVINFNLGIHDRNISEKHWIYFPEPRYPFYRLGFPHNFSSAMAPAGCSSLYGEYAYFQQTPAQVNETLQSALRETKRLLQLEEKDIATQCIIPISHAYVIYDRWRERNVPRLLKALKALNIYSVGRYGEWKYSSMQEAVLDGKKIAQTIVDQLSFPRPTILTNESSL